MLMNVDVESYAGFEPASTRMKTLCPEPLDEYDMNLRMEPAVRIERTTSRLQGERCYQLSYADETLSVLREMASTEGVEPSTAGFGDRCSAS